MDALVGEADKEMSSIHKGPGGAIQPHAQKAVGRDSCESEWQQSGPEKWCSAVNYKVETNCIGSKSGCKNWDAWLPHADFIWLKQYTKIILSMYYHDFSYSIDKEPNSMWSLSV